MISLHELQRQHEPWATKNFGPNRPATQPLRGITEEWGELMLALEGNDNEAAADSLADFLIFAVNYCNAKGWDAHALWIMEPQRTFSFLDSFSRERMFMRVIQYLGRLNHSDLKCEQKIRGDKDHHESEGKSALAWLFVLARDFADMLRIDLLDVTEKTWREVSKRDFTKNSKTGEVSP